MKYYNTNNRRQTVSLEEAVFKGLAADGGLYMPERIPRLPQPFINNMKNMSLPDIGFAVANFYGCKIDYFNISYRSQYSFVSAC